LALRALRRCDCNVKELTERSGGAPGTGNQYAIYGCWYPSSSASCTGGNISAVGNTATQGAGLWGQLDLAGNVQEWNLDSFNSYVACRDCTNLTASSGKVVRGGQLSDADVNDLKPPARFSVPRPLAAIPSGFVARGLPDTRTTSGSDSGALCASMVISSWQVLALTPMGGATSRLHRPSMRFGGRTNAFAWPITRLE